MSEISNDSSIQQLNQLVAASKITYKQMFEMNRMISDHQVGAKVFSLPLQGSRPAPRFY